MENNVNQAVINQEITLTWPEGFHVMDGEELRELYQNDDTKRWGIRDKTRHLIITILWEDYSSLLIKLSDIKAVARKNEKMSARGYRDHGYRREGFFSMSVDGRQAEGYRFSYRIGEADQSGQTLLFKVKNRIYSISCIGRSEKAEEDRALFERILEEVRVSGAI